MRRYSYLKERNYDNGIFGFFILPNYFLQFRCNY